MVVDVEKDFTSDLWCVFEIPQEKIKDTSSLSLLILVLLAVAPTQHFYNYSKSFFMSNSGAATRLAQEPRPS